MGVEGAVLEIGFYDERRASEFAKIQAQHFRKESERRSPDGVAIDLLLGQLRHQTQEEGGGFAGYSPVLIAVARRVADRDSPGDRNTQKLISRIRRGEESITLSGITRSILERERQKLARLDLEDPDLVDTLYRPAEQLARLVAHLNLGSSLPTLPPMSDNDRETYHNALEGWVPDHPFLHGDGNKASSEVFDGLIASHALQDETIDNEALSVELLGAKINPFLADFYIDGLDGATDQPPKIPASHLGVLYASVRAGLAMGENASLRIEGEVDEDESQEEPAEVEIVTCRAETRERDPLRFNTDADGHFRLGPHVEDVDISAPYSEVTLGPGSEALLVAPVSIEAGEISLEADRIVAESPPTHQNGSEGDRATVWLRSEGVQVPPDIARPICRAGTTFRVSGPWTRIYPWRQFSVAIEENPDPRIAKAERALFRILRLSRSHSSGVLGAFRAAVDDLRRTRGPGAAVRNQLIREGVLTEKEHLYELHLERLASEVGLTFQLVRSRTCTTKTIEFLRRALSASLG